MKKLYIILGLVPMWAIIAFILIHYSSPYSNSLSYKWHSYLNDKNMPEPPEGWVGTWTTSSPIDTKSRLGPWVRNFNIYKATKDNPYSVSIYSRQNEMGKYILKYTSLESKLMMEVYNDCFTYIRFVDQHDSNARDVNITIYFDDAGRVMGGDRTRVHTSFYLSESVPSKDVEITGPHINRFKAAFDEAYADIKAHYPDIQDKINIVEYFRTHL